MTPPTSDERIWTAALLVIGDEILSGRTQDKNVSQVALWLNMQGIRLTEVRVVPDDMDVIGRAVVELKASNDYLFTTGGIGPTHDDITVDAIARALEVDVIVHPKARKVLEDYYGSRGGLTDARLRMARVPDGAELIENRMSGAPGIRMGNIFILAGVPHIAGLMLEALSNRLEGGRPMLSRTVGCWVPESEVADLLREVEAANSGSQIGSYPFFTDGRVGANFVVRSIDAETVDNCIVAIGEGLVLLGYVPIADGILLPAT
jgi:molybdenum cofactor synthesis domain-containing protein